MILRYTFLIVVLFQVIGYSQNVNPSTGELNSKSSNRSESEDHSTVQEWNTMAEYHKFSRPDSGIYYASKALELARSISYSEGELWALVWLALSHQTLENYTLSAQVNLEGLREAEKWNQPYLASIFLMDLGICYLRSANYERALSYSQRAFSSFRSLDSPRFSAISASTIGRSYSALNNADSAFFYGREAIRLAKSSGINYHIHWTFTRMADTHRDHNNLDSALYYFQESIRLNDENAQSEKSYDALEIAKLFMLLDQNDSALKYAGESLQLALENSLHQQVADACLFLSDYFERSEPIRALQYNNIAIRSKDSLEQMRMMTGFSDLIDFDEQQRREEILAAKDEFENRLRSNVLLGSTFTLFLLAIFLFRNNRMKQRSKQEIEFAYEKLKATQSQLIHSEKMASLGELTAGIAHEIQNPLNFVNNFSEINAELFDELKEEITKGNEEEINAVLNILRENEHKIKAHGQRADAIVKSMLQHSRIGSGEKELTDINALCDEYLRLAYHGIRAKKPTFSAEIKHDLDPVLPKIKVQPQEIGRVLVNLINNSFQAVTESQNPEVKVSTAQLQDQIQISVSDNGPGIPDEIRGKIFQPFFTTKPTGQGTGLGLSLSYDIVKAHSGEIKVESNVGRGTTFIVRLPI